MDAFKKIHWVLGAHAFMVMLFLIIGAIILGIFLFYQYVILVQTQQEVVENAVKFKYGAYQNVLDQWQAKDQKFQELRDKNYSNPFAATSE